MSKKKLTSLVAGAVAWLAALAAPAQSLTITSQLPVTYTNLGTLYAGASPSFAVAAAGTAPLSYQWYTNGVAVGGATNAALTLTNVAAGLLTNYCLVTNLTGSATSQVWTASVLAAPAAPFPQAVLAAGPAGYWRLNEGPDDNSGDQGAVCSDYAGGNDGIYTNATLAQPGYNPATDPTETAAEFGETGISFYDSYAGQIAGIDFATPTNKSATFSIQAWVNGFSGSEPSGAGLVSKGFGGGGEQFDLDVYGGAYRFFVRDASGTTHGFTSTNQVDGNWHYLVGVCDEVHGNVSLYVDGVLAGNGAVSPTAGIITATNLMCIGARSSSATSDNNYQFYGYMNDVAVFKYALSATQVQNLYNAAGIAPRLAVQLPASLTTNAGANLTVTALPLGTPPLALQWTLNGNPLPGATNATLSLTNLTADLNGQTLNLTITNTYGTYTGYGTTLNIISGAPQITTPAQPAQLALYVNKTFTYSVAANGTAPLYYQWLENGTAIPGATNATYTATAVAGDTLYGVAVSNNFNGGSITLGNTVTLTGVALPTSPYPAAIVAAQPAAYWRLDEPLNATTANDYAGGHDGTYNNAQLGVPGYSPLDPDTAASFGGTNSSSYLAENNDAYENIPLLDFAAPAGTNAEFSVECWVNGPAGQNSAGSAIVCKGNSGSDEFVLDASAPNGKFRFYLREAGGTAAFIYSSSGPDGNWHHLVAVCDEANGIMTLYVDGVPTGAITGIGGTGLYESAVPASVGAQNGGSYQFNGTIDEVSLYNYALTAGQVQAHYTAAPEPPYFTQLPPTNVLAYVGQTVTLAAATLGSTPQTNQWYINNTVLTGQTGISLVLNNVPSGTNVYTLKVSNAFGAITNTPGTVLAVAAGSGPPQLLANLTALATARYATLPITWSVSASGSAPLAYQWYFNGTNAGVGFTNAIAGATNASYTIPSLTTNNNGNYFCLVSNSISVLASYTENLQVVPYPTNVYPQTVLLDHPLAYYRLDEPAASATGYDYAGGNNGQYKGSVVYGVAGYGSSSNFDADTACTFGNNSTNTANCYLGNAITNVDFAKPNGQNGAFSLEVWLKGTPGVIQNSGGAILAKGYGNGGEQFSLDVHSGIRFYVRNAAGSTLANAQTANYVAGSLVGTGYEMDGKWHHVVAECDQANSNLLLYVDGTLIGPNVITNGVVPPLVYAYDQGHNGSTGTNGAIYPALGIFEPLYNTNLWNSVSVGSRNKGSGNVGASAYTLPFVGSIDEVALYNYVLTPAQVYTHYAVGAGLSLPVAIQHTNGLPVITWPSAAALQSANSLTGPWTTLTNATSPWLVPPGGTQLFYRLQIH